ncbi:DNRLRE domain-containing protein [bacterium]|nr:DNRLRE domain-containing protein [bacterium]
MFFIIFHLNFWVRYAQTDIVTIYPAADNGIDSDNPTIINSSASSYGIGHTNSTVFRYIAQFDILSIIPPGASINSATFYIYEAAIGTSGLTLRCYQLTENWTTQYACWNNRDNAIAWTNTGGTFNPAELGNYTYQDTDGAEASYPATSTVQDWWNTPTNNNGLLVKNDIESGQPSNHCGFYTVNTEYNNYRPKLVIDYTPTGETQVTIAKDSVVDSLCKGGVNLLVGTFKYYADNTSEPRDLSTITLTEYGTCDADSDLSSVKLFTDTDGIYSGTESQLAITTTFNTSNHADFNFSATPVTAEYATTNYIHVVLNVSPSAIEDTTVGIEITSSGDVTISSASDDISTYAVQLGTVLIKLPSIFYYVNSSAPDDSGVPDGNPDILDNCWKTVGQAFSDLCTNESNDLTGKGRFFIQIQNSDDYEEGVTLQNLTTTSDNTLTIRSKNGERPTWINKKSTVLFCDYDGINSYGCLKINIPYVTVEGINFTGTKSHGVGAGASFTIIRNCIFHDLTESLGNYNHNSAGIYQLGINSQAYNNTFYDVISGIFKADRSGVTIRNNIFYVNNCCSTEIEQAFLVDDSFDNNAPDSDYNIFYVASGTRLAYAWSWAEPSETYTTLANWQGCYISPDANSISGDPKLVTPGSDFHLKSIYGHWTTGGWVNDAESSPCLDAGAPYSAGTEYTYYDNEPEDNGDRVNMGAYANTEQASRSGIVTLSISVNPSSYDFGTVLKNSTNAATSSITVTNNGDVNERYSLHLAAPAGWTCVTDTAPGVEEFRMCGNFQTATAQSSHFDIGGTFSDAIGTTQRVCSTGDFAKDDEGETAKGYNVPPSEERYLWFRFESPTSTGLTTQQTITVTITAEQQP